MTSAMNVPDGPIRMYDSIFNFNVHLVTDGLPGDFRKLNLIVRLITVYQLSGSRHTAIEIQHEIALVLLRPVTDVGFGTPGPTARVAEFLRLGQISLALTQLLLRALAVGDVDYGTCEFDEIAARAENRMTNAVNVPDGATRMHNAIIHFFV